MDGCPLFGQPNSLGQPVGWAVADTHPPNVRLLRFFGRFLAVDARSARAATKVQIRIVTGFSIRRTNAVIHSAATAPSMTR